MLLTGEPQLLSLRSMDTRITPHDFPLGLLGAGSARTAQSGRFGSGDDHERCVVASEPGLNGCRVWDFLDTELAVTTAK